MMKQQIKKYVSVFLIFILSVSFAGCGSNASGFTAEDLKEQIGDFYEEEGQILDWDSYASELMKILSDENAMTEEEIIDSIQKYASELSPEALPIVEKAKQALVDYYNDVYQLDFSEEMDTMNIYQTSSKKVEEMNFLAVTFENDFHNREVAVSTDLLSSYSEDEQILILIHEFNHYIALIMEDSDESQNYYRASLLEGLTEVMTEEIVTHTGVCEEGYENITSYKLNKEMARQLFLQNEDLMRHILSGESFDLYDYTDKVLSGKYAKQLELADTLYEYYDVSYLRYNNPGIIGDLYYSLFGQKSNMKKIEKAVMEFLSSRLN